MSGFAAAALREGGDELHGLLGRNLGGYSPLVRCTSLLGGSETCLPTACSGLGGAGVLEAGMSQAFFAQWVGPATGPRRGPTDAAPLSGRNAARRR